MTTLLLDEPSPVASEESVAQPALRCDTLAESVTMLVLLTLLQPALGFARSILFCRWLSPSELGQWDVVQGFLMLSAPMAVWGISGSFGRFCAHYRHRGALKSYLARASGLAAVLAGLWLAAMLLFPGRFAYLIFGESSAAGVIPLVTLALACVIGFSYVTELLTALRLFRVVSVLQLLRSAAFLGLGCLILWSWKLAGSSVVAAYAAASALSIIAGGFWLRRAWKTIDAEAASVPLAGMIRKVAPFALWVWLNNALTNLFEVVDRYMIVHFSQMPADTVMLAVGNYHSSRVVPLLLVAFSGTLVSMLVPHFSHSWEEGKRQEVGAQRNLVLKVFGTMQFVCAVLILFVAPWLFGTVLEGKYAGGQAILPLTLVYCLWFCLALVAEATLWCAEEVRLATAGLVVGMAVTIGLNLVLLPMYGLLGAVVATALGKLTLMLLTYLFNGMLKLPVDRGVWLISLAPLALAVGVSGGAIALACLAILAAATNVFLTADDKHELIRYAAQTWQRFQDYRNRAAAS